MSTEAGVVREVDSMPINLPPHLLKNFENAEAQIRDLYGKSPDVQSLVRLWLACGTSWHVRREFERAVLDIHRESIKPVGIEGFDDDTL